jgi:hypothetical protein
MAMDAHCSARDRAWQRAAASFSGGREGSGGDTWTAERKSAQGDTERRREEVRANVTDAGVVQSAVLASADAWSPRALAPKVRSDPSNRVYTIDPAP